MICFAALGEECNLWGLGAGLRLACGSTPRILPMRWSSPTSAFSSLQRACVADVRYGVRFTSSYASPPSLSLDKQMILSSAELQGEKSHAGSCFTEKRAYKTLLPFCFSTVIRSLAAALYISLLQSLLLQVRRFSHFTFICILLYQHVLPIYCPLGASRLDIADPSTHCPCCPCKITSPSCSYGTPLRSHCP